MKKFITLALFMLAMAGIAQQVNTGAGVMRADKDVNVNLFYEDFETFSIPGNMHGWTHYQSNSNQTWFISNIGAHSGVQYLRIIPDVSTGLMMESINSSAIDLTGTVTPMLSFWFICASSYWAVDSNTCQIDVIGSIDNFTTETTLWREEWDMNWQSVTWYNVVLPLPSNFINTSNFKISFLYNQPFGLYGTEMGIDDVSVYDDNMLFASEAANQVSIRTYPNPANDFISISADETIIKAEIFSISGALHLSELCSKKQVAINLQDLAEGLYQMRITTTKGVCSKPIQIVR